LTIKILKHTKQTGFL